VFDDKNALTISSLYGCKNITLRLMIVYRLVTIPSLLNSVYFYFEENRVSSNNETNYYRWFYCDLPHKHFGTSKLFIKLSTKN